MNETRLEQAGAAAGVVFVGLLLASFFVVAQPPHINASFFNIANYYVSNRGGLLTSSLLTILGSVFLLWFVGHLRQVLQRSEAGTEAFSPIVFISGTALAIAVAITSIPQATLAFGSHRIELITNAGVVRSLFYMLNITYALALVLAGLFLITASVAILGKALVLFPVSASVAMVGTEQVEPALAYAGLLFGAGAFFGGISGFYVTSYSAWWLGLQYGGFFALLAWVLLASVAMVAGPELARAEAEST